MNIDKILTFWSLHNTTIIESLIVVILVLVLALAYLSFFVSNESETSTDGGVNLSGRDLTQVLNTVLQAQSAMGSMATAGGGALGKGGDVKVSADLHSSIAASGVAAPVSTPTDVSSYVSEIERAKAEIANREKVIEDLKIQIKKAQEEVSAASAKAVSAPAASGEVSEETKKKLADLEQRLAEYEIISEDIADLSKYKEENSRLTEELERLRKGAMSGAIPTAPASAPPKPAPLAAVPDPIPTPSQAAVAPVAQAPGAMASSTSEPSPGAETPIPAAADLIGDDLMKEFEAAVASQKGGALKD